VSPAILLDSGPLGQISHPKPSQTNADCFDWFEGLFLAGRRIVVPEIADYEIRRELLRASKSNGLAALDRLIGAVEYLPITTIAMRQAAVFWAQARKLGYSTAGDKTIDADVILAAQAATFGHADVIIATTNIKHLSRYVPADLWHNIS
jgi:predicted nucleic acid-binding protein